MHLEHIINFTSKIERNENMRKKFIILICVISLCLIGIVHFFESDYYVFDGNTLKFPNANKTLKIIDIGGIDQTVFQIMEYNSKDIEKIIKQDFKKINVEEVNEIYEKAIEGYIFRWYLNEDEKQAFIENFDKEMLFNTNNYYLFYEDTEEPVYEFMLFIIDVDENKLYYILGA